MGIAYDGWVAFFTAALTLATVALAVTTYFLWKAGERQMRLVVKSNAINRRNASAARDAAIAAQQQVALARDNYAVEHRPWVSLASAKIVSPLTFDETNGSIDLTIELVLSNSGRAPAVNTWIDFRFVETTLVGDILRVQEELAINARSPKNPLGSAVFVGRGFGQNITASISREDLLALDAKQEKMGVVHPYLYPAAIIVIAYTSPTDKSIHDTRYLFDVIRDNGPIRRDHLPVPRESLILRQHLLGNSAN